MLIAFSVTPLGTGSESVGDAVAEAVRVVRASGLPYRTDAMFTTIEGEWDEVMPVVRDAMLAAARGGRVSLVLKADERPGVTNGMESKVRSLEERLAAVDVPSVRAPVAGGANGSAELVSALARGPRTHRAGPVTWDEFAVAAHDLARRAERLFEKMGVVLLGTIRADGTPRISPLECPFVIDGQLLLGMMWQSRKARDLQRDPRCVVQNAVADAKGTDGEVRIYGRVREIEDPELREMYAGAVAERMGWEVPEPYHLFALEVERASYLRHDTNELERWSVEG